MTYYKVLTHDYRPPVQGGDPIWDGLTLPYTLPLVELDRGGGLCAAGWNCCESLATAFQVAGLWSTGRPSVALVVSVIDGIKRGEQTRASAMVIERLATAEEIEHGIADLSVFAGASSTELVGEQLAWREALSRPRQNKIAILNGLREALAARSLQAWTLHEYPDTRAAEDARDVWNYPDARGAWQDWDAWGTRTAWDAYGTWRRSWPSWATRGARAARDARNAWSARAAPGARGARAAWTARGARGARAARAARDAGAALMIYTACSLGWCLGDPSLLTIGIRDAYRSGLTIALPTGPKELGWVMADA